MPDAEVAPPSEGGAAVLVLARLGEHAAPGGMGWLPPAAAAPPGRGTVEGDRTSGSEPG